MKDNFKFTTKEEIKDYFRGDKIVCLICGKPFRGLIGHLFGKHSMSADDYRDRFGLPYGTGLVGCATRDILRDRAETLRAEGILNTGPPDEETKQIMIEKSRGPKRWCPADIEERKNRLKNYNNYNISNNPIYIDLCMKLTDAGLSYENTAILLGISQPTVSVIMKKIKMKGGE